MRKFLLFISFFALACVGRAQDSTASKPEPEVHEIDELSKLATSDKYGFTGEFPIKVGGGYKGGVANQRAYLLLLRDAMGKPVSFRRLGSCCQYKSKNALFGDYALVDKYEIEYRDKDNKKQTTVLYISFYDYEEPLIPVGFRSPTLE